MVFLETVKYDNENFYITNYDSYSGYAGTETKVTEGSGMYRYKNFALVFTKGKQRVIADKIVLDYGLRFALTPGAISSFLELSDRRGMSVDFRDASTFRLFREQLVNFHIGIGFLAF